MQFFKHMRLVYIALLACLSIAIVAIGGCGGAPDDGPASSGQNTPLSINAPQSFPTITAGATRTFSATISDVDGVESANITLDGAPLPINVSGSVYSITLPGNLSVGTHTLVITGRGKAPDGTLEVPRSVTINFRVFPVNTPATVSPISGPTSFTTGTAQTLTTVVTDPNGLATVTATLDGATITVVQEAGSYSVALPASLPTGYHTVVFTVTGLQPDGTPEAAQTVTQSVAVFPPNTPLVISAITGPLSYSVGSAQTYTVQVMDPDMIVSVLATLDGASIPVAVNGSVYSITAPANTPLGNHILVFTATGKLPEGGLEAAQSVSLNFTVTQPNDPLSVSGINETIVGSIFFGSFTYSINANDGDGIQSVIATVQSLNPILGVGLAGPSVSALPAPVSYPVVRLGSTFSIDVPTFSCARVVVFTVTGILPGGAAEGPVVATFTRSLAECATLGG